MDNQQDKMTRNRLLMQARRLVRLIKLNAPSIVICNEVSLLSKTIMLLEDAYLKLVEDNALKEIGKQKNSICLCAQKGCQRKVMQRIDESQEFGQQKCQICFLREKRIFDAIEEKARKEYGLDEEID